MSSLGLTPAEETIILNGSKRYSNALAILKYVSKSIDGATCDECAEALGLTENSGSPRFSELERAGCLEFTGVRKTTRAGGIARVCRVTKNANFRNYFKITKNKTSKHGLSQQDSNILAAGKKFLKNWHKNKKNEDKSVVVKELIMALIKTEIVSCSPEESAPAP